MKEEGEVAEAAPFPEAAAAPEPHPRQSGKREHRHGVAREQREMLSEALAMSRRAAEGDVSAIAEEEGAKRRAQAVQLARQGVLELMSGAPQMTQKALRAAAHAAVLAAAGMGRSRELAPEANEPAALFEASPFGHVRRGKFRRCMEGLRPVLRAEQEAGGGEFFRFVDVDVMLRKHVESGLCPNCRGTRKGARRCYIYGMLLQLIDFELPWSERGEPEAVDCKVIGLEEGKPKEAYLKSRKSLESKGILERVPPAEQEGVRVLTPAFMVARSAYALDALEAAATSAAVYDVTQINELAELRAKRLFDVTAKEAEKRREAVYSRASFEAAQAAARGEPKWRVVQAFDQSKVNEHLPDWDIRMASFSADFIYDWDADSKLFKKDLEKGFYAVRVSKGSRKYLCFRDPDDPSIIWRFARLPMGLKISPALFSMLTGEFVQCVRALDVVAKGRAHAAMYIDDFGGIAPSAEVEAYERAVAELGAEVGLSWAPEKSSGPSGSEVLLGVSYTSNVGGRPMMRVAGEQLFALLVGLHLLQLLAQREPQRAQVPASFVQSLAGRAGWVAQTTYAARMHIGSLWYCARMSPHSMVPVASLVSNGVLQDAAWFISSAAKGTLRGQRLVKNSLLSDADVVRLFSDASGSQDAGAGATWGKRAIWHRWSKARHEHQYTTQAQELHPIVAAARKWGAEWAGRIVIIGTDNLGNALGINTGKAGRGRARELLAELYDLADAHGFELLAVWVPREHNVVCDALSKASTLADARRMAQAVGAGDDIELSEYNLD